MITKNYDFSRTKSLKKPLKIIKILIVSVSCLCFLYVYLIIKSLKIIMRKSFLF